MKVFVPKESVNRETRTALTPDSAKKLIKLGFSVFAEKGLGLLSSYKDEEYSQAGVQLTNRKDGFSLADLVLRVRCPEASEVSEMKSGTIHLSFLDPFGDQEVVKAFAKAGVDAISLEMLPRSTLAQKMDALSSQANLAGYYSVIAAASRLKKILPMMMTPAGTITPSRFFIIGVGVAGLQAIATAKRLGARVEAFDTRPVVEEQVRSLGAKFVKIDIGETGQTAQGYAKELTPEQIRKQQEGMAKVCAQSDVVITTAKLFGRKAPILVTKEMLAGMQHGSIVVDLAAESGGNVEGTKLNEEVLTDNGVTLLGLANLEGHVATHASQMYAANLANLLEHFFDKDTKQFNLPVNDEIVKSILITKGGQVVHEKFKHLN
ncbi:MAG: NAD(P) transhydrogenase subunit alpha [Verrucomicrobia bacterium GWC2_42_7]|nr:MAG: NAD(P) transhydrogenase subunit alpha [Verrucomicrobia bacterium GWC2_42_7]